jgi:hypothetical protein
MSDNEEGVYARGEDGVPQRTSSAPPVLEVQEQSLFALGNNYAHFFSGLPTDIRTDDDYLQFYQTYNDPSKLPPPLEPTAFELPDEELLVREVIALAFFHSPLSHMCRFPDLFLWPAIFSIWEPTHRASSSIPSL